MLQISHFTASFRKVKLNALDIVSLFESTLYLCTLKYCPFGKFPPLPHPIFPLHLWSSALERESFSIISCIAFTHPLFSISKYQNALPIREREPSSTINSTSFEFPEKDGNLFMCPLSLPGNGDTVMLQAIRHMMGWSQQDGRIRHAFLTSQSWEIWVFSRTSLGFCLHFAHIHWFC